MRLRRGAAVELTRQALIAAAEAKAPVEVLDLLLDAMRGLSGPPSDFQRMWKTRLVSARRRPRDRARLETADAIVTISLMPASNPHARDRTPAVRLTEARTSYL